MSNERTGRTQAPPRLERIRLSPSPHRRSWLLYIFEHAGEQRAVWLHELADDTGHAWQCSCGANDSCPGAPLTAHVLREAWSHFDTHGDPAGIPLHGPMARWYRGGRSVDLDETLELEVQRILGREPERPVEVVSVCGMCGETFEISDDDPHWETGRGPICPRPSPPNGRSAT